MCPPASPNWLPHVRPMELWLTWFRTGDVSPGECWLYLANKYWRKHCSSIWCRLALRDAWYGHAHYWRPGICHGGQSKPFVSQQIRASFSPLKQGHRTSDKTFFWPPPYIFTPRVKPLVRRAVSWVPGKAGISLPWNHEQFTCLWDYLKGKVGKEKQLVLGNFRPAPDALRISSPNTHHSQLAVECEMALEN